MNALNGKKVLMFIAPNKFQDTELLDPKILFESNGAEVVIASKNVSSSKGVLGNLITIDTDISKIVLNQFHAIIFVGGSGATVYFHDEDVLDLVKAAAKLKMIIGAICIAPSILANAGILKNKKATAFYTEETNLKNKGAEFIKKDIVVDGNIVTANGPKAAKSFAEIIIKLLTQ